ncbi:MAG: peptidase family protein [Clostridiaceae bacterium]|jgi:hypothetical protein|nr:peptidase family protein [Clostridiaceae bacterium]
MKKLINTYILTILLVFLFSTFQICYYIHPFKSSRVIDYISYLSSDSLKGRLAGTVDNAMAAQYVKEQFQSENLLPYKGSYYENFSVKYPYKMDNKPYLKIYNQNKQLVKEFNYGIDYKEDMLNFKIKNISFNVNDKVTFSDSTTQVTKGDHKVFFYVPEKNNINFRSSFINDSSVSLLIMVTQKTNEEIENMLKKGYTVSCYIPYEVKDAQINNVTAYIKGKNPKLSPIIISGHFDHVGTDLNGTVYNGALDNASGISFVMELSNYVKSLGKPERDIIFVGFNAEEFGCLGSKEFVEKYKSDINGAKVFNFDMIGSNNSVPLCIMGGNKDTNNTPLIKSAANICKSNKIYFNYLFEDSSDHEYFRKENIDAITFIDNDLSRIHTPNDKVSFIDSKSIDRCFGIVSQEVIANAFNNNFLYFYYKEIMGISLTLIFAILLLNRDLQ